jgi:hypothetical protein
MQCDHVTRRDRTGEVIGHRGGGPQLGAAAGHRPQQHVIAELGSALDRRSGEVAARRAEEAGPHPGGPLDRRAATLKLAAGLEGGLEG